MKFQVITIFICSLLWSCVPSGDMFSGDGTLSSTGTTTPTSGGSTSTQLVYDSEFDLIGSGTFNNTRLLGGTIFIDQDTRPSFGLTELAQEFGLPTPVAYYPMDGTMNAIIPNGATIQDTIGGKHCSVTNTDSLGSKYDTGKVGTSVYFDGTDTICDTPFILNPVDQDYSIVMWVKFLNLSGNKYMLDQLSGGVQPRTHFQHYSNKLGTWVGGSHTGAEFNATLSTWYHLAVTVSPSNSEVKFYVDGRLIDTQTKTVESATGG